MLTGNATFSITAYDATKVSFKRRITFAQIRFALDWSAPPRTGRTFGWSTNSNDNSSANRSCTAKGGGAPDHLLLKLANNCVANVAGILSAVLLLFAMVNLKAAPPESSALISFPPSTAQKWILSNGLTAIVQEDHSAPVASVQAWCA